jgi:hypothetical protein
MASSLTGISLPGMVPALATAELRARRRRRIGPQAGHALEILGHAIEYLADEYVLEGGLFSAHDPRLEAIQLLMARNREIYYACPKLLPFGERVRAWLHIHSPFVSSPHRG